MGGVQSQARKALRSEDAAPERRRAVLLWCVLLATLAIRLAAVATGGRVWGIDALRYFHPGAGWIWFLLGVMTLGLVARLGNRGLGTIRIPGPPAVWLCVLAAGAFLGFLALSDATHLLGDGGRVMMAAIAGDRPPITEVLASVLNRAAVVAGQKLALSPERSLEILSAGLGAAMVVMVVARSRAAGTEIWQRALLAGSILLTGGLQLAFGYVENYLLLQLLVIAYLLSVLVAVRDVKAGWEASVLLALAIGSHLTALCLLPAHAAFLALLSRQSRRSRTFHLGHGALMLGILAAVIILFRPQWYRATSGPLWLSLGGEYGVFSGVHLLDLGNELALVAPIAIPLAMLTRWRRSEAADLLSPFFGLAAGGSMLLMAALNPALGMARDWDLLALSPLVITIGLGYHAARNPRARRWVAPILLTAAWCVAPWVLVNHSRPAAVARFGDLLRLDHGRPGTAYGYELLATYHRSHGNPAGAIRAMVAALEERPGYRRYIEQTTDIVRAMDQAAAADLAQEIASGPANPPQLLVRSMLSSRSGDRAAERQLLADLGHWPDYAHLADALTVRSLLADRAFDAAAGAAASALERRPEDPEMHFLSGLAHLGATDCAGAVAELETAVRLGWVADDIDFHLGFAHDRCGDRDAARSRYERYLRENPHGRFAEMARRKIEGR